MSTLQIILLVILVGFVFFLIHIITKSQKDRIKEKVEQIGGELISIKPVGNGDSSTYFFEYSHKGTIKNGCVDFRFYGTDWNM